MNSIFQIIKECDDGLRKRNNIMFLIDEIIKVEGHEWCEALVYKKV